VANLDTLQIYQGQLEGIRNSCDAHMKEYNSLFASLKKLHDEGKLLKTKRTEKEAQLETLRTDHAKADHGKKHYENRKQSYEVKYQAAHKLYQDKKDANENFLAQIQKRPEYRVRMAVDKTTEQIEKDIRRVNARMAASEKE
jgi:chromosome segregation ATPase